MENQTEAQSTARLQQNTFLTVLLSVLLFISILIAAFFAYQTQKLVKELQVTSDKPTPTQNVAATQTPDPTADWKTYPFGLGYSFKYPSGVVLTQDGDVAIMSDSGSEIRHMYNNKATDIESLLNNFQISTLQVIFTSKTPITLNGMTGYKAKAEMWGEEDTYIILKSPNLNGVLIFYYGSSDTKAETLLTQILSTFKFTNSDPITDWKIFKNEIYSFRYPSDAKYSDYQANVTKVSFMGQKQIDSGRTQTELFDGYAFIVADVSVDGNSLDDIYQKRKESFVSICDPKNISASTKTTVGGKEAITYTSSCLGDYQNYILSSNQKFYEINILTSGDAVDLPKYKNISDQILSTFKFTN